MIVYLTFGDQPSGIYRSQVEDFVLFQRAISGEKVRLVAFISGRNFFANRKIIRSNVGDAIVVPMFPKLSNWKRNRWLLYLILRVLKPRQAYGRGVFATLLLLKSKRLRLVDKVVYDGRGAISAEWHEYKVVKDSNLINNISKWEFEAVNFSDKQIAVSTKLIEYWKSEYRFHPKHTFVVPCTLDRSFTETDFSEDVVAKSRKALGVDKNNVVLVYSGSIAGWQSINVLFDFLTKLMGGQKNIVLLFLGKEIEEIQSLSVKFKDRVRNFKVKPHEVNFYLKGCDYGLLVRENSLTNQVASPVKFAEYLSCGLKVIMSKGIGDYSEMLIENDIGFFYDDLPLELERLRYFEKKDTRSYALSRFKKEEYRGVYNKINEV